LGRLNDTLNNQSRATATHTKKRGTEFYRVKEEEQDKRSQDMKRPLTLFAGIALMATTHLSAQEQPTPKLKEDLFIGPNVGVGNTWVSNLLPVRKMKAGGNIGLSFLYARDANFGYSADLAIAAEGHKRDSVNEEKHYVVTQSVTPLYLRLPLRVYYMFMEGHLFRPMIFAGPSFAYKLGEYSEENKVTGSIFMRNVSNDFRMFDVGVHAGAGMSVRMADKSRVNLTFCYYQGLTDAVATNERFNRNENLSVNLSLLFVVR
jgi:hypothetical protein